MNGSFIRHWVLDRINQIKEVFRSVCLIRYMQQSAELERVKHQYDKVVARIPVGIYILRSVNSEHVSLDYVSPQFASMLGLSEEALLSDPMSVFTVIHPDDSLQFIERNYSSIDDLTAFDWEGRIVVEGQIRWVRFHSVPEKDEAGHILWHGVLADITDRKCLEEKVAALANNDPVTNLPNRRVIYERLSYAMAMSRRSKHYGAFMFIDLDNFKHVNDTYGHNAGDQLLRELGDRMLSCVRETDTVARFGGDEFVVLLSDLEMDQLRSMSQASHIAEEIRSSLGEEFSLLGGAVLCRCTVSIGVAMFNGSTESEATIIDQADVAMYRAKEAGKNSVQFFSVPTQDRSLPNDRSA